MGASSSKSSSTPQDMTPSAFKNLQQPFADVLKSMIDKSKPGVQNVMTGYTGPTTTAIGGGEQTLLNQLMQTQGQQPQQVNLSANVAGQPTQPTTGVTPGTPPVGGGGGSLPGMGGSDALMQQLLGRVGGSTLGTAQGPSQGAQDVMASAAASGQSPQAVNQFVQGLNLGPQQSLGQFTQGLGQASQTGAFGADAGSNPFAQAYIDQAQRQTMQNLEETLSRTLPGRFTQAGHIIQPQGSSAFDRAAAIASRGATQEMGDIASRISYQALESARGREADAMGAELARGGDAAARIAQAQQAQLDRALQVPGMEAQVENLGAQTSNVLSQIPSNLMQTALQYAQTLGQQATTGLTGAQTGLTQAQTGTEQAQTGLVGAQTGLTQAQTGTQNAQTGLTQSQTQTQNAQTNLTQQQVQAQEVDTLIKNLQAQALPRLIADLGVERGMEAFQNNVNSMLSVLGIAGGVTRPVISQESKSSSGGFQLK